MIDSEEYGLVGEMYTAGQYVGPGRYQRVGRERVVVLVEGGILPPSFDGEIALYRRLAPTPMGGDADHG